MSLKKPELIEQKITQRVTVTAGSSGKATVSIPQGRVVYLKGYGYTWYTGNTFTLSTGNALFPSRTDQEGSVGIPVQFGRPFLCRPGGELSLTIANADSVDHSYDVIFYLLTEELLNVASTGGDLYVPSSGSIGTVQHVAVYDSTNTTAADVVARGDGKNALCVDTELELHLEGSTFMVDNIEVGSTDGTTANAKMLRTDADGKLILAANSGVDIGDVDVAHINGVAPQFDDTDKMAVSVYGGNAAAGDTYLYVDATGHVVLGANSGVDIGDVDVTSLPSAMLDNTNELKVSLYGTESAAGDTAVAVDAAGNLQVDIVSGTVTATVGAARTATHAAVTVGNTSTSALAANANRKAMLFQNDSNETIYLSIGGVAAANTGIRLDAGGGAYEATFESGNLSAAAVTAICASGGKNLLVTEWA